MKQIAAVLFVLTFLIEPAIGEEAPGPRDYEVVREQAEQAYLDRDSGRAVASFRLLTELFPEDPEAWFGLSKAYEWSNNLDGAIAAAKRVQELGYVGRPYLSYRLAQLNARAGHCDEALRWLELALIAGFEERPKIGNDEAFVSLRQDPKFIQLAGLLPAGDTSRLTGLQFDLNYLVEEAQRMHAGPDRRAYSPRFEQEVEAIRSAIPSLTDPQFLGAIMRLVAILGDGHSGIYGPDRSSPLKINMRSLPLKFYWFDEGLFITDAVGPMLRLAGSRVVKFGDLTSQEVLARMSNYRGFDNGMTWKWMGPQFFLGRLWLLREIGATDTTNSVELTLAAPDGSVSQLVVEGSDYRIQRKLRPSPAMRGEIPLYLSHIERNYWMESLPKNDALYFQFNQVRDDENESIEEFSDRLANRLEAEERQFLIVDVRHNNGGNNSLVLPLIRVMIAFERQSDEHRIYVITGRNTFSAAQNFINQIEKWTAATFVGEPSSSSPNFVGEETNLLLPYSRVRGSISTKYWQDSSPGDERRWITPDIPANPTAQDYFEGRDAALDAVFHSIRSHKD